jgi:cytochrome c oxidase cbb3-type subunit 3/ubiquinol-cytochrome c reductase cytochrome c subunit
MDFPTLYKQNCAGCHGENGRSSAAISLANPVYLVFAGQAAVRQVTANGVAGTLMPPFAQSAGGTLTDSQIDALVDGMFKAWGTTAFPAPPYSSASKGDPVLGEKAFAEFCARCHGDGGAGMKDQGSIVDASYLTLVSEQSLRSTVVAGAAGMPDWRSAGSRAMTNQEITDVVAWLATKRVAP